MFNRATLESYWKKHRDAEGPLRAWFSEVRVARWTGPEMVRARYRTASFIGRDRIVFNIKGNAYRLVVRVDYDASFVFIRFFGTHAQYDKIDVAEV